MAKSARKAKIAKHVINPTPEKTPKWTDPFIGGDDHPLAWRFSGCDDGGPFCWSNIEPFEKYKEVMLKLLLCLGARAQIVRKRLADAIEEEPECDEPKYEHGGVYIVGPVFIDGDG